ncbi:prepilin-type N-terminal cleavage/methylation domain-containing protein [Vibrio sp. FNV 38]|nr:prepilin-type N-terminal cleavage/methylation domain-containing protein [Vibrio sp. FNV 38]
MKLRQGFTLIESIIAIIVLAIAMLTITTMLIPNVQRSADPQYQVRAAALAETIFSQILSRSFDHNSDHQGGFYRCGETSYVDDSGNPILCTPESAFGPEEAEQPSDYNDVDDYSDSNGVAATYALSPTANQRDLNQLIDGTADYANFLVDITVTYEEIDVVKKIVLSISAGSHGPYSFTAYKGNY